MTTTTNPIAQTISEAYALAIPDWTNENAAFEITTEVYDEALGCVPPVYGYAGRFWVGEPWNHDRNGNEISLECWYENPADTGIYRNHASRYYCRMCRVRR